MAGMELTKKRDLVPERGLREEAAKRFGVYFLGKLSSKLAPLGVGEFIVLKSSRGKTSVGRVESEYPRKLRVAVEGEVSKGRGRMFVRVTFGWNYDRGGFDYQVVETKVVDEFGNRGEWIEEVEIETEALKKICEFFGPENVNSIVSAL